MDIGNVSPLGITRDGSFYYASSSLGPRLFTATLDLEKGTAAATPLAAEKFNITDQFGLGDWSPDGEHLAYWARRSREIQEIRIVSMKTGQTRVLKPDLKFFWRRLRWSPDGRFLLGKAFVPKRGIYQIDAASGQASAVVEAGLSHQPVWSPDGKGIFYADRPSEAAGTARIMFRDLRAQTDREILSSEDPAFNGGLDFWFDLSPDGRQLALLGEPSGQSMTLWLIPVDGGAARELLKVNIPGTFAGGVGWTPDGQFVLFTQLGGDETQRGLWYISANGGTPRKVTLTGIDARKVTRLAVHPDGKQLALFASGSGKAEVWALENFLPPLEEDQAAQKSPANAPEQP
jgi:Tol biopolymer transport system component